MSSIELFYMRHRTIILLLLVLICTGVVLYFFNRKGSRKKRFKFNDGSNNDAKDTIYSKNRRSTAQALHEAGTGCILLIAFLLILAIFGVDVTAPLAGLGIIGTIIGLAMQDFLKDMIMGLRIVHDEFFSTGDFVRINGITGLVVNFSLLSTKIENIEDHSVYTICNGQITGFEQITNLLDIRVPVAYEVDHKTAKDCVQKICARIWMLSGIQNCYYKGVEEFGESTVWYLLRCSAKPDLHPDLKRQIQSIIREVFAERGLEVPFNQLDVHMK